MELRKRKKKIFAEGTSSYLGTLLRHPTWRIACICLHFICWFSAELFNPISLSFMPVSFPIVTTIGQFLCTHNSTIESIVLKIICICVTLGLSGLLTVFIQKKFLQKTCQLSMFSWRHAHFRLQNTSQNIPVPFSSSSGNDCISLQDEKEEEQQEHEMHQMTPTDLNFRDRIVAVVKRQEDPFINHGDDPFIIRVKKQQNDEIVIYKNRLSIQSDDQGSFFIGSLILLLCLYVLAVCYNYFAAYGSKDQFEKDYVISSGAFSWHQWQSICFNVCFCVNGVIAFAIMDSILQDNLRCEIYYQKWMKCVRKKWNSQLRIWLFWVNSFIALGIACSGVLTSQLLPYCRTLLKEHISIFSIETGRSGLMGLLFFFDTLIIVQDWEFPRFGSILGNYIPGLACEVLAFKIPSFGLRKSPIKIIFCAKWILGSLLFYRAIVDGIYLYLQLTYEPSQYGQFVKPSSSTIYSINNTSTLCHSIDESLGCQGYSKINFESILKSNIPYIPIHSMHYVDYPFREKLPALFLASLGMYVFFHILKIEKCTVKFSTNLHGTKASIYEEQLNSYVFPREVLKDLRNLDLLKKMYKNRMHLEDICCFFSIFGIVLMLLQLDTIWRVNIVLKNNDQFYSIKKVAPGSLYTFLILFSTSILVVALIRRYKVQLVLLKLRNIIPPHNHIVWCEPTLRNKLLLELVLNLLIAPPFLSGYFLSVHEYVGLVDKLGNCADKKLVSIEMNGNKTGCYYSYDYPVEIFGLLMYARLYWLARMLRNHSGFSGQHSDFVGSLNNVSTNSVGWNFRCLFHTRPSWALLPIFFLVWALTSVAVTALERPLTSVLDGYMNSIWLTIITMSSVGYGDLFPRVFGSRLIMICGGIFGGIFMMSMLTSFSMDSLSVSPDEKIVLSIVSEINWREKRVKNAAVLMQTAWKYYKANLCKSDSAFKNELYKAAHQFRLSRRGAPKEVDTTKKKIVAWGKEIILPHVEKLNAVDNEKIAKLEDKISSLHTAILNM